jgi:hypothetical protein
MDAARCPHCNKRIKAVGDIRRASNVFRAIRLILSQDRRREMGRQTPNLPDEGGLQPLFVHVERTESA